MLCFGIVILYINLAIPKSNIVVSAQNAVYCLDSDGVLKWSFPHTLVYNEISAPAIGNLDNFGNPKIAVGADKLYYFNCDGNVKWSYSGSFWLCSPVMANVDTTGNAEIITADSSTLYCFNSDGSIKWSYPISGNYSSEWIGPAVATANVDTNGVPSVFAVTPTNVYCMNGNGTLKWSYPMPGDYLVGIGVSDIDLDGNVDIIVNTNVYSSDVYYLYCLKTDGTLKWSYSGNGFISQPAIADINKDSQQEIVVHNSEVTPKTVIAFQENTSHNGLNVVWTAVVEDITSISAPPPVICDIDGDGDKDVLWVGCINSPPTGTLYILNGMDGKHPDNSGATCYTDNNFASRTLCEHGCSVADIDGDGYVEIVGISPNSGDTYGVAAIECDASWATGRNIFSSQLYHISEVNDNVSIPNVETANWKSHNTWLTQLTTGGTGFGNPTLKWSYSNSTFGWIVASISIAPLSDISGVEENSDLGFLNVGLKIKKNPFVQSTMISYQLPVGGKVSLNLYDVSGSCVKTLVNEEKQVGSYSVCVDAKELRAGIYFVKLRTGNYQETKKVVLMR
ncbi:MAG: FG-GAP-like repeat-containing protein [bacterium]|nr:FG-GAP-like repeat-containing protein [bacterium]